MKKVIGISIVAMFAAVPMMANAAKTATLATLQGTDGVITANKKMATTSYVQGAYNAIATEHNKVVNDITLTGERVTGDHISNTASVAENLESLNSAIKSLSVSSSADYVTKSTAAATPIEDAELQYVTANGEKVGENLGILDAQVFTNATDISTLNSNTTVAADGNYISAGANVAANLGALDGQMKTNTDTIGAYDATKSHTTVTNTNVFTNLQALDAQVSANSNTIVQHTSAIGTVADLQTAGGLIPSSTTNLVDAVKAINTSLSQSNENATVDEGDYVDAGDTVSTAIGKLDAAIKDNADDITDINATIGDTAMGTNADTITGAIREMHDKQLTVYTTWNTDATDKVDMF